MVDLREIELYLPKYLSPGTEQKLFKDLSAFPNNIDQRLYMSSAVAPTLICQGDGIDNMLVVELLPDFRTKRAPCMILSNTCDIDPSNERLYSANVIYAPIMKLDLYRGLLFSSGVTSQQAVLGHLDAIKLQRVTQIFYLPSCARMPYEGIVFYDRLVTYPSDAIDRSALNDTRLFTLSQYGHYLFLFKLSMHFTRITERIDRAYSTPTN